MERQNRSRNEYILANYGSASICQFCYCSKNVTLGQFSVSKMTINCIIWNHNHIKNNFYFWLWHPHNSRFPCFFFVPLVRKVNRNRHILARYCSNYFITEMYTDLFLLCEKIVEKASLRKPGSEDALEEYKSENTLKHSTRRHLVNILASHMTEMHGYVVLKYSL